MIKPSNTQKDISLVDAIESISQDQDIPPEIKERIFEHAMKASRDGMTRELFRGMALTACSLCRELRRPFLGNRQPARSRE